LKVKVTLEALRNGTTTAELAGKYQLLPQSDLRLEGAAALFSCGAPEEAEVSELYAKIG